MNHKDAPPTPAAPPVSFFDAVGGEETFSALVRVFYELVKKDDILGPMYPPDDMEGAQNRLKWFLEQYWGGPDTYNLERGHPRLRMRHAEFTIDSAARDRWLKLMSAALDTIPEESLDYPHRAAMWDHMVRAADMLVNTDTA